ncbi:MAG: iron oxidase [Burkholderiales bacterium]|nr:iron oxidase [Burkholderiales bacterium]
MAEEDRKMSRRAFLKGATSLAKVAGISVLLDRRVLAAKLASKETVHYQWKPNGDEQCSSCLNFRAGPKPNSIGACHVVEGQIAPNGWCIAFSPNI